MNSEIKHNSDCLGVVLAGGLSSRMGTNKAELKRNTQTMLDFSQQQLKLTSVSSVVVSGKAYGLADKAENIGPLGGIFSVIEEYRPRSILVMPVDLPFIDHKCLEKLKEIGEISQQACYYEDNFLPLYIPVTAYLETFMDGYLSRQVSAPKSATNVAKKNGPSMKGLLASVPSCAIKASNSNQLFNTNTLQEWQQAEARFHKQ